VLNVDPIHNQFHALDDVILCKMLEADSGIASGLFIVRPFDGSQPESTYFFISGDGEHFADFTRPLIAERYEAGPT